MTGAVEALPTFAHVRALRPSGTHPVLVHSAPGSLVHALYRKQENLFSYRFSREYRAIIYLRSVGVALVGALKEGDLITRGCLEFVAALRWCVALIYLQSAYVDIHTDEFSHPSTQTVEAFKTKIYITFYIA